MPRGEAVRRMEKHRNDLQSLPADYSKEEMESDQKSILAYLEDSRIKGDRMMSYDDETFIAACNQMELPLKQRADFFSRVSEGGKSDYCSQRGLEGSSPMSLDRNDQKLHRGQRRRLKAEGVGGFLHWLAGSGRKSL